MKHLCEVVFTAIDENKIVKCLLIDDEDIIPDQFNKYWLRFISDESARKYGYCSKAHISVHIRDNNKKEVQDLLEFYINEIEPLEEKLARLKTNRDVIQDFLETMK